MAENEGEICQPSFNTRDIGLLDSTAAGQFSLRSFTFKLGVQEGIPKKGLDSIETSPFNP